MKELLFDALLDTCKSIPVLFLCYLLIEYMEHRNNDQVKDIIRQNHKRSIFFGSLVGLIPQCGFSVAAANLFARGFLSLGTLIAIFITTSDEAPLLFISESRYKELGMILLLKLFIALFAGYLVDSFYPSRKKEESERLVSYHEEHCEHGIVKEAIAHTAEIALYILLINIALNILFASMSDALLNRVFLRDSLAQVFILALIGMFPNCAASIFITKLYFSNALSFASLLAGLISVAGLGYPTLIKYHKNRKEDLRIILCIYFTAVISGSILYYLHF